jgi:hypothetical protein
MKNIKEGLFKAIEEKIVTKIGETSISLGEKSFNSCIGILFYEPKISAELLQCKKNQ